MKPRSILVRNSALAFAAAALTFAATARAATFTWDAGNTANGTAIDAASGTWDTTAGNIVWNNGTNVIWSQIDATTPTNAAVFGGADGTYAITIGTALAAQSLTFNNTGYTLSAASPQTLTLSGTPSITVASNKSATIGTNINVQATPGLTIIGGGGTNTKLTMTADNTYTGATTVTGCTLAVNGTGGKLSATSSLMLNGGTLQIGDATAANGVANRINTAATLSFGSASAPASGTFQIVNGSTTLNDQALVSLTVNPGLGNVNGSSSTNRGGLTFTGLNPYTRSVGGAVVLDKSNFSGITFSSAPSGTGNVNSGLLVGAVSIGANSSPSFLKAGSGALGSATTVNDTWTTATPGQVTNVNSTTLNVPTDSTTTGLQFNAAGSTYTVNLLGINTLQTGGILLNNTMSNGSSINGGTLKTGIAGGDIWIDMVNRSPFNIGSILGDNSNSGLTAFSYTTGAILNLTGENSYKGNTTVLGGVTLNIGNGTTGSIDPTGTVIVGPGATLNINSTTALANAITNNGTIGGTNGSISGNISGSGVVNTSTAGTLTLGGTNNVTGLTASIAAAAIRINGGTTNINNAAGTGWGGGTNQVSSKIQVSAGTLNAFDARGLRNSILVDGGTLNIGQGSSVNTTGGARLVFSNGGAYTVQISSGALNFLPAYASNNFGVRLGNDNGPSNTSAAATVTATQTGGTFIVNGAGGQENTLSLGTGAASQTNSYALSGGTLDIRGSDSTNGWLTIGADIAGTGSTTFTLSDTGKLIQRFNPSASSGGINGRQAASAAKQVFELLGGTLVAGRIDATNLRGSIGGTNGTLVNNGSTIAPGDADSTGRTGKTAVTGALTLTSGSLAINIAGAAGASIAFTDALGQLKNDIVAATGAVTLGGNLVVSLVESFTPTNTDTFTIITGSSVTSNFANLTSGRIALAGGASFLVNVNLTSVTLTDYQTGSSDPYLTWINNGWPALSDKSATGDPDGDGINNLMEYVLNGNPVLSSSAKLPALTADPTNLIFSYTRRVDSASDTTQIFERSTNLSDWTTHTPITIPTTPGTTGFVTVGSPSGTAPDQTQTVSISIPKGSDPKLFGRLVVTQP